MQLQYWMNLMNQLFFVNQTRTEQPEQSDSQTNES